MIDNEIIQREYAAMLDYCSRIYPLKKWQHQPKGVDITYHKTKYGMARSDGMVFIAATFLGTNALTTMQNTLKHEFAHLAAGLKHGHDKVFKHFERLFGADFPKKKDEVHSLHAKISYKWRVLAHLDNGEIKELGGAHRRSRVYLDYPQNGRIMRIRQNRVKRFEFIEN